MRSKRPLLVGLAAVALAGLAGCVASSGSVPASAPSSFAVFDPCAVPSGDYPPGKLELMQQICHQTLPPVEGLTVPWLDAPYTGPRPTPTVTADVKAAYPRCSASDLDVTFAGWNTQDDLGAVGWIVARAKGSVTCLIEGAPQVSLRDASGSVLATGMEGDGSHAPVVVRPGLAPHSSGPLSDGALGPELAPGYAYGQIRLYGFCDPAHAPATVDATLPNGLHARLEVPPLPAATCQMAQAPSVVDWWFRSVDQPQPKVLPASWLQPIVSLPEETVVGQTMHFTVALQNDLAAPVTLEPCPAYTISVSLLTPVGKGGPQLVREYALNCAAVKTIPPKSAVAFDMQFDVPADVPLTDKLWLNWSLGPKEAINVGVLTHPVRLVAPGS
jgi:Protein of unknown function (DUF4232)